MDSLRNLEDKLREAACYGDLKAIQMLLETKVDVNARNAVNGWTALHWAVKRGYGDIISILLSNGADKRLLTENGGEISSLTQDSSILKLLGEETDINTKECNSTDRLVITPHYLAHPAVGYKVDLNLQESQVQRATINMPTQKASSTSATSTTDTISQELEEELVLKVRVANTDDPDFIEVEIPQAELTFSRLLQICCAELRVDSQQVQRVRKLPNTILRKDKDVRRLEVFQEIEIVLKPPLNAHNGTVSIGQKAGSNGYQSISAYKNQTIIY